MRVMLITGSLPPMRCGVGDYSLNLAQALVADPETQIAVLTGCAAAATESSGRVSIFASVKAWRFSEFPAILRILRRWRPDIVHIQYPTQGYGSGVFPTLLPALLRLAGFRVTQTWHEARQHITVGGLFWLLSQLPVFGGLVVVRPRYESMMPRLLRIALKNKLLRFIPNASALHPAHLTSEAAETIRQRFGCTANELIVYFGFIYPAKGVDLLFEIADPAKHHLVIIGDPVPGIQDTYFQDVRLRTQTAPWSGRASLTGFLPAEEVAAIIAAAGAVVLPFAAGGGEWNTSIHGAQVQGVFVLTTSTDRHGYDPETNTYFARPNDLSDMKIALSRYFGHKNAESGKSSAPTWSSIAAAHLDLYRELSAE